MVYVHIDSRNRDETKYPFSNTFVVTLHEPVKMITNASILTARLPQGPSSENYLFVDIPELKTDQVRDAPELTSTTSVENGKSILSDTPSGRSMNHCLCAIPNNGGYYSANSEYKMEVTYDTPIEKLSRITVKIVDFTGIPVNIGTSNVTILLDLTVTNDHMEYSREPLPEPVKRPQLSKPAVQINNKFLIIGLGIIALLFIILVPKKSRGQ
jgi:hypothetical protein